VYAQYTGFRDGKKWDRNRASITADPECREGNAPNTRGAAPKVFA